MQKTLSQIADIIKLQDPQQIIKSKYYCFGVNNRLLNEQRRMTYNLPLLDVVEEHEVTEHGDEAEEPQAGHYVDHGVL